LLSTIDTEWVKKPIRHGMADGWRAKESLALMLQLNTRIEMKEITLWLTHQSFIRMRMRIGWMQMWWWQPIGAKSDQQVNICGFAVRCDRMWPSTQ